jgi:hypothetical protein
MQGVFLHQKLAETSRIFFAALNDSCSAQYTPIELKLASLKLPGNEDSEYVFKIVEHPCE